MRWIEEGGGILTLIGGDIEDLEDKCQRQSLNDLEGGHLSHSLTKKLYSTQYSRVYTMKLLR